MNQMTSATGTDIDESTEKTVEDTHDEASPIPWYLRVKTPSHPISHPLAERQKLPELPLESPPLLQPMLEHISLSLGLDDLRLFDLRDVDPPPALGANLMVIIGTARSEKHLHVSADRFCRWLRTSHKLTPFADGLLGRGELKLKMRRKARRAKIMSHVGAIDTGNPDDGIRTGWVCVNVGTVQDGRPQVPRLSEIENFVGFSSDVEGANIIVQMLVQEKRDELELERLLDNTIRRHKRRQQRLSDTGDNHTILAQDESKSITVKPSAHLTYAPQ